MKSKPLVIYEYQLERLRPFLGNMVEGRDYVVAPNRIPVDPPKKGKEDAE